MLKKREKKTICFQFFFLFFSSLWSLGSLTLDETLFQLTEAQKEVLFQKGSLRIDKAKDLTLLPQGGTYSEELKESLMNTQPHQTSQVLYLLPKKKGQKSSLLYFYNSFREFSRWTQASFYNESKKIDRVLYHASYRIASPQQMEPLPDFPVKTIPLQDTLLVRQDLGPINDVLMQYDYSHTGTEIFVMGHNIVDMRYGSFRAMKTGAFRSALLVFEWPQYFLLYGASSVRISGLAAWNSYVFDLFIYRARGFFDWYEKTYLTTI